MVKFIITIEEVSAQKSEFIVGTYLISHSNFGDAYILGVPCKIMSEPYVVNGEDYNKKIKVMSCITGIEYVIPYDLSWFKVYDTFDEVLTTAEAEKFLYRGYHVFRNPLLKLHDMYHLVGKKYYPMDNSYSEDTNGERLCVANTVVEIVGVPFIAKTPFGNDKQFVTVKTKNGKIGKCLFMEWKLVP